MKCANCGAEIDSDSVFCTECGAGVEPIKKDKKSPMPIIAILLAILAAVACAGTAYFVFVSGTGHENQQTALNDETETEPEESLQDEKPVDEEPEYEEPEVPDGEPVVESRIVTYEKNNSPVETAVDYRVLVKNVDINLNIRSLPDHSSELVQSIPDSTPMYYYGESDIGPGSDGLEHYWYKVYLDDGTEGWVRSDLVVVQP